MSGGQQEANAVSEMYDDVRKAAKSLAKTIEAAKSGYRGAGLTDGSIIEAANLYLSEHGFELRQKGRR